MRSVSQTCRLTQTTREGTRSTIQPSPPSGRSCLALMKNRRGLCLSLSQVVQDLLCWVSRYPFFGRLTILQSISGPGSSFLHPECWDRAGEASNSFHLHELAQTSGFQGKNEFFILYHRGSCDSFLKIISSVFQDAVVLKRKLVYAIESGAGFELS